MKNLVVLIILSACAGYSVLESKPTVYVENTGVVKKDAYNKALAYLAKNLGNSNYAIRLKDPDSGKIITKMSVPCNEIRLASKM